jgi:hypothetical protein
MNNTTEIFACETCDKKFTTKFSLNRHQLVHNNVKNFTCRFCPKKFALKQYLKEHECIHTNEKPYVCGVNGCQQRFRQRGKLSLHRRRHKGYRMKEYHLLSKGADASHDLSETATIYDDIHQENEHEMSVHIDDHTAKSSISNIKKTIRRTRKAKQASDDTDSDFEIPTYSKPNDSKIDRNIRIRKGSYKNLIKEEELSKDEDDHMSDSNSERKYEDPIEPYFTSKYLTVPTQKFRKVSDDSTIEGSICGKRGHLKSKKEDSGVSKNQSAFTKPNPNFEYLVKASEIHNQLNTTHSQFTTDKCEELKISE